MRSKNMSPEARQRLARRIRNLRGQLRMVRSGSRVANALITLCGLKSPRAPLPLTCRAIIAAADKKRTFDLSRPFKD